VELGGVASVVGSTSLYNEFPNSFRKEAVVFTVDRVVVVLDSVVVVATVVVVPKVVEAPSVVVVPTVVMVPKVVAVPAVVDMEAAGTGKEAGFKF